MKSVLPALALLSLPVPAAAQSDLRFCPNRPSLGASACTTDAGRVQLELGGPDWQRDRTADMREDRFLVGDTLVRAGLDDRTELQVDWAGVGRIGTRDRITGATDVARGIGDTTVALRRNLRAPDGTGFSFGVQPLVVVPTGTHGVGAGDWAAGLLVPVTYDLSEQAHLSFTGEADAAVDDDRHGRHFAASAIVGLGYDLLESLSATGEIFVERDHDPRGHVTRAAVAGSLAWQPATARQLDLLVVAGLDHDMPDVRVALGGAILF